MSLIQPGASPPRSGSARSTPTRLCRRSRRRRHWRDAAGRGDAPRQRPRPALPPEDVVDAILHALTARQTADPLRDRPRRPDPGASLDRVLPDCAVMDRLIARIVEQSLRLWNNRAHVTAPGPARRRSASAPPAPPKRSARTASRPRASARPASWSAARCWSSSRWSAAVCAGLPRRPLLLAAARRRDLPAGFFAAVADTGVAVGTIVAHRLRPRARRRAGVGDRAARADPARGRRPPRSRAPASPCSRSPAPTRRSRSPASASR